MIHDRARRGFTLIELLVVIAIIAILIALLVPAVQAVRESANRTQCMNQMRQIALAIYQFQNVNRTLPTYHGKYPAVNNNTEPSVPNGPMYGSWVLHILPYIEQEPFYNTMLADIQATGKNQNYSNGDGKAGTPTGPPVTTTTTQKVTINGVTYEWEQTNTSTPTTGGVSSTTTVAGINQYQSTIFPFARCPSDPSAMPDQLVSGWAPTNYLANFNALTVSSGDGSNFFDFDRVWVPRARGYYTGSGQFRSVTDGLTNTVLLAEGYANCDNLSRITLYALDRHNFGITANATSVNVTSSNGILPVGGPYDLYRGMPNTFMFQVKPLTKIATQCPSGAICCERWRAQTPHSTMPVAMMDASVRNLAENISQDTWTRLMLPRDGLPIEEAW